jgi:hypothetical protein
MKIIEVANKYVGEFEISGNHGFKDPAFQKKIEAVGWHDGEAWCCYLQEALFKEAYPEHIAEFDKLFSSGAVRTLANFKNAGYGISTIPKLGSLMIMQHFEDGIAKWQGHAGVVISLKSNSEWISIEGNTNSNGGREGDSVQPKNRSLMYHPTGLRVAGFVMIRETLKIND